MHAAPQDVRSDGSNSTTHTVTVSNSGLSSQFPIDANLTVKVTSGAGDDILNVSASDQGLPSAGTVQSKINSARAAGAWTGKGITSTSAKNASPKNTTLGVLEASDYSPIRGNTFSGQTVDNSAVLVKYTYYGDTEFSGLINFDDYNRTDAGYLNSRTGWLNGDFDADGAVDFDDHALIDVAFLSQSGALRGGRNPYLDEIVQTDHFTIQYLYDFIDWCAEHDIYYTVEDFFPDGLP